jgi:hypothetical protein
MSSSTALSLMKFGTIKKYGIKNFGVLLVLYNPGENNEFISKGKENTYDKNSCCSGIG